MQYIISDTVQVWVKLLARVLANKTAKCTESNLWRTLEVLGLDFGTSFRNHAPESKPKLGIPLWQAPSRQQDNEFSNHKTTHVKYGVLVARINITYQGKPATNGSTEVITSIQAQQDIHFPARWDIYAKIIDMSIKILSDTWAYSIRGLWSKKWSITYRGLRLTWYPKLCANYRSYVPPAEL